MEKFKNLHKNGLNQAEAFKSIIKTVEMAKAKNIIKDRAKEVEVFQDTINNLMSYFLNSLMLIKHRGKNKRRVKQELQTKDNTIDNV